MAMLPALVLPSAAISREALEACTEPVPIPNLAPGIADAKAVNIPLAISCGTHLFIPPALPTEPNMGLVAERTDIDRHGWVHTVITLNDQPHALHIHARALAAGAEAGVKNGLKVQPFDKVAPAVLALLFRGVMPRLIAAAIVQFQALGRYHPPEAATVPGLPPATEPVVFSAERAKVVEHAR